MLNKKIYIIYDRSQSVDIDYNSNFINMINNTIYFNINSTKNHEKSDLAIEKSILKIYKNSNNRILRGNESIK